jgi:type IV secretory pathway VirB2 component (pilin)
MGKFVLGLLLSVVSFAFAQTGGAANPLCAMVQALSSNWGIIMALIMLILGGILVVSAVMYLVQTKFAIALAIVVGGTVLLVAAFRLLDASGRQLETFARTCTAQIEFVQPVAKIE